MPVQTSHGTTEGSPDPVRLGEQFLKQRKYADAMTSFEQALALDSTNECALAGKLTCLRLQRRFEDAWALLDGARDQVSSARLRYEEGMLYFDQKQHAEAVAAFDAALRMDPALTSAREWRRVAEADWQRLRRRFASAEQILDKGLEEFPRSVHIINQRGLVHYDQRQYGEAGEQFRRSLELDPGNPFATEWKLLSEVGRLRTERQYDKALAAIRSGLPGLVDSPSLIAERGWVHLDQGATEDAQKDFREALEVAPELTHLQFNQVELLVRTGHTDEALEILLPMCKRTPDHLILRERLGWLYMERHDLSAAMDEFEYILKKDPENLAGVVGRGSVLFQEGRYAEAEEDFRAAIAEAPGDVACREKLAWSLIRQDDTDPTLAAKRLDEAEALALEALGTDARSTQALGCLGVIAFKRGRIRESERYLLRSTEVCPSEGNYTDLGALYVHVGKYDEAEAALKKATQLDPEDAWAWIELGNLYVQTERMREAIRVLRRAAVVDPRNAEAQNALATVLIESGNWSQAQKALQTALRQVDERNRWRLHLTMARLMIQLGDQTDDRDLYGVAMKQVNDAIRINPRHADAYFHKGVVASRLGDYSTSIKSFKSCISHDTTKEHIDAERYARRMRQLTKEQPHLSKARYVLIGLVILQLVALWIFTLLDEVSEDVAVVLLPILIGLLVVVFILPSLIRLKLPGMEAVLSQPRESLSSGPSGEVSFRSAVPIISTGPR